MSENRDTYIRVYDSLPREAKDAMQDLWMTGRNESGVWVRFKDVEVAVGRIVEAIRKEEIENA